MKAERGEVRGVMKSEYSMGRSQRVLPASLGCV